MTVFRVIFPGEIQKSPGFQSSNLSNMGEPNIIFAASLFSEAYWPTPWQIALGSMTYEFDAGDIPYIWDELPERLSSIDSAQSSVTFYLVAQWRNTQIIVEPGATGDEIYVSIMAKRHHPDYWDGKRPWEEGLAQQRFPVLMQDFVGEWKAFARKVIEAMVSVNLISADDPSIAQYLGQTPWSPDPA